jgi:hypothetical protein
MMADLAAIAIELDRTLTPNRGGDLDERAARVVDAILADSRDRAAAIPPAKTARLEFWRRPRRERLQRGEGAVDEAGAHAAGHHEAELGAEPDEVRMARPVLEALRESKAVRGAADRVRVVADRPLPARSAQRLPALRDVTWTADERLTWEEFIGGVPCQGCGRPFLGDETRRQEGEAWPAYRGRMARI